MSLEAACFSRAARPTPHDLFLAPGALFACLVLMLACFIGNHPCFGLGCLIPPLESIIFEGEEISM